jgi:hypothetical protein
MLLARHCLLVQPGRFRGWGEDDGARRACGVATGHRPGPQNPSEK